MCHINKIKNKKHDYGVDAEKVFGNVQHSLMIKILKKLGIGKKQGNITKAIQDKPMVSIILNREKLEVFPPVWN